MRLLSGLLGSFCSGTLGLFTGQTLLATTLTRIVGRTALRTYGLGCSLGLGCCYRLGLGNNFSRCWLLRLGHNLCGYFSNFNCSNLNNFCNCRRLGSNCVSSRRGLFNRLADLQQAVLMLDLQLHRCLDRLGLRRIKLCDYHCSSG